MKLLFIDNKDINLNMLNRRELHLKILVINIYNPNADRPLNSTVDNNKPLSKTNSVEKSTENYAFLLVVAHRLQNPKNITIGRLNVNSLRNKKLWKS